MASIKSYLIFSSFRFHDAFYKEYGAWITELFVASEQEWVTSILRRELNVEENDDLVYKEVYNCRYTFP